MDSLLKMHEFASARGDGLRPEMLRILMRAAEERAVNDQPDGVAADRVRLQIVASQLPATFPDRPAKAGCDPHPEITLAPPLRDKSTD